MITIENRQIDYDEAGSGPAILFIPGSYSTYGAWNPIRKSLPQSFRFVATSICDYGGTQETRTIGDLGMDHQIRLIEAVANKIVEPVHLVGHSFGGAIAFGAAFSKKIDVLSITTFEANPFNPVVEGRKKQLLTQTRQICNDFEAAYYRGEPDAAGRIIDFWGGENSFANMPEPVKEYCQSTVYANVLDWRTAFSFEAGIADYSQLKIPVQLVRGGLANPLMVEITNILNDHLPDCRHAEVDQANHFLITSHAKQCAALLAGFLKEVA